MHCRLRTMSLIVGAGFFAGCGMLHPTLPAAVAGTSNTALNACEKAEMMWNGKIVPSIYGELPALTAPGLRDLLDLASTRFTIRSLTNDGDELDAGRRKSVHARGAVAHFRFDAVATAAGYTGIYADGSGCVIGRLSMATKPTKTNSVPALALKFFVSGKNSVNLHVMNSVDGQQSHNFFELPFSNIIPPPDSLVKSLLQTLFRKAAVAFGAKDSNPAHLTVEHLAGIRTNGSAVPVPKSPYRLIFKPTPAALNLMKDATVDTDFRANLARFPIGQAMCEVYAFDKDEAADDFSSAKTAGKIDSDHDSRGFPLRG